MFSLYRSAGLSPVFVLEKDILALVKDLVCCVFGVLFALEGVVSGRIDVSYVVED
jgi:hypothetical protein